MTTPEGLRLRLKVYPKGISEEKEKGELKMVKRTSKNEDYLGVFIELVEGPSTKQKHQLVLRGQGPEEGRQFSR